jgi:hypothetical protein
MKPKKHPLARDAGKMKDKRFNKLFTKAFREAPEEVKQEITSVMKEPSIMQGEMNANKMNALTDLVQGYLNNRAKSRTGKAAKAIIPGLAGSAVSATSRQPRYVPGVSGAPGPHRLTNIERFARMLGLGPY